jgi:type 2A phosphatase activator TIP41
VSRFAHFFRLYQVRQQLISRAEKRLNLPLPEMTFGNNSLSLSYSSTEGDVEMKFNGLDALAEVGVGEGWEDRTGGAVLVAMAEFWGKNRLVDPFTFNSTLY